MTDSNERNLVFEMKEIFEEVVKQLNLGGNLLGAEPIHGGALHKMWRIETESQVLAINHM